MRKKLVLMFSLLSALCSAKYGLLDGQSSAGDPDVVAAEDFYITACYFPTPVDCAVLTIDFTLVIVSLYLFAAVIHCLAIFQAAKKNLRSFDTMIVREPNRMTNRDGSNPLEVVVREALGDRDTVVGAGDERRIESARQHALACRKDELNRKLWPFSAIAWTAPAIGLFGTVIAVMESLYMFRMAQHTSFWIISDDVADALSHLAFGLAVAIPAFWSHGYFSSRTERLMNEVNRSSAKFIEGFLERGHGRASAQQVGRITAKLR